MSKTVLAIDYGRSKTGLAISRSILAQPIGIVRRADSATQDQWWQQICDRIIKEIEENGIDTLVVGLSENEMASEIDEFVKFLQEQIEINIIFFDETLSSQTVRKKMINSGMKKSKRQQPIDHLAAAEFLQEWLDSNSQ